MKRKLIGQYFTFKFARCKYDFSGVVLDYNDDWTLIRDCDNYKPGGFTIFKNEKVEYSQDDKGKMAMKILRLRNYNYKDDPKITLGTLDEMLHEIDEKYRLIQLDTLNGCADILKYLGKVGGRYVCDELTPTAKWRYKLELPEKEFKVISFDNDYTNSLKLVTKFKKSHE